MFAITSDSVRCSALLKPFCRNASSSRLSKLIRNAVAACSSGSSPSTNFLWKAGVTASHAPRRSRRASICWTSVLNVFWAFDRLAVSWPGAMTTAAPRRAVMVNVLRPRQDAQQAGILAGCAAGGAERPASPTLPPARYGRGAATAGAPESVPGVPPGP
ncbi:hypothetical protein BC2230_80326 [Burkholderia cepacia]